MLVKSAGFDSGCEVKLIITDQRSKSPIALKFVLSSLKTPKWYLLQTKQRFVRQMIKR
jgi:hypothetical protein